MIYSNYVVLPNERNGKWCIRRRSGELACREQYDTEGEAQAARNAMDAQDRHEAAIRRGQTP